MSDLNAGSVAVDFDANLAPLRGKKAAYEALLKDFANKGEVRVKITFPNLRDEVARIRGDVDAALSQAAKGSFALPIRLQGATQTEVNKSIKDLNAKLRMAARSEDEGGKGLSVRIPVSVDKASVGRLQKEIKEAYAEAQAAAEKQGKAYKVNLQIGADSNYLIASINKALKGQKFNIEVQGNVVTGRTSGDGGALESNIRAGIDAANRRVTSMSRAEILAELEKFRSSNQPDIEGPTNMLRGRNSRGQFTGFRTLSDDQEQQRIANANIQSFNRTRGLRSDDPRIDDRNYYERTRPGNGFGVPQSSQGFSFAEDSGSYPQVSDAYTRARRSSMRDTARINANLGPLQRDVDRWLSSDMEEANQSATRAQFSRPFGASPMAGNAGRFGGPIGSFDMSAMRAKYSNNLNVATLDASMGQAADMIGNGVKSLNTSAAGFYNKIQERVRLNESEARRHFVAGLTLSMAVTAPAIIAGGAITKNAMQFQSTMEKSSALAGISESDIPGATAKIFEVAKDKNISQNVQDLAEGFYQIASSNLGPASTSLKLMEISAKGASAGLGNVKTIAEVLTSVVSVYGHNNKQAAGDLDILTSAVREGKGEASDFAPALGKVVAMGKIAGIGFNELAANIAVVTRAGITSTQAATGLNMLLNNIVNPTKSASEAMRHMGLSAEMLRKSLSENGLLATMKLMMDSSHGNVAEVAKLVGSVTGLRNILSSAGAQAEAYQGVLARVTNSYGAADEAAAKMATTLQRQFERVINSGQAFFTEVGLKVLPGIAAQTEHLADVTPKALQAITSGWESLPAPMTRALQVMGGFALLSGPFLKTKALSLDLAAGLLEMASAVGTNPLLTGALGAATLYATMRGMDGVKSDMGELGKAMSGQADSWQEQIVGILGWAAALGIASRAAIKAAPTLAILPGGIKSGIRAVRGMGQGADVVGDIFSGFSNLGVRGGLKYAASYGSTGMAAATLKGEDVAARFASRYGLVGNNPGSLNKMGYALGGAGMTTGAGAMGLAAGSVLVPTAIAAAATSYQLYIARTKEAEVEAGNLEIRNKSLSDSFDKLSTLAAGNKTRSGRADAIVGSFESAGDDVGKLQSVIAKLNAEKSNILLDAKLTPGTREALTSQIDDMIRKIEDKKISLSVDIPPETESGLMVTVNALGNQMSRVLLEPFGREFNADALGDRLNGIVDGFDSITAAIGRLAVALATPNIVKLFGSSDSRAEAGGFLSGVATPGIVTLYKHLFPGSTPAPATHPNAPASSLDHRVTMTPYGPQAAVFAPKDMKIEDIKKELASLNKLESRSSEQKQRYTQLLLRLNNWKQKTASVNGPGSPTPSWVDQHRDRQAERALNTEQAEWQSYISFVEGAAGKVRGYGEHTEEAKVRNDMFRLSVAGINDELKEQAINLARVMDRMEKMTGLRDTLRGVFEGAESKRVGMGMLGDPGFLKEVQKNFNYVGRMNSLSTQGNNLSSSLQGSAKAALDSIEERRVAAQGLGNGSGTPTKNFGVKPGGNPSSPNAPRGRLMPNRGPNGEALPAFPTGGAVSGSGTLAPMDVSTMASASFVSKVMASKPDFDGSLGNLQKVPDWMRKAWGPAVNENSLNADTRRQAQGVIFGREGTKALVDEATARGTGAVIELIKAIRIAANKYDSSNGLGAEALATQKMGRETTGQIAGLINPGPYADLDAQLKAGTISPSAYRSRKAQRAGLLEAQSISGTKDIYRSSDARQNGMAAGLDVLNQGYGALPGYDRAIERSQYGYGLWHDLDSPVLKAKQSGNLKLGIQRYNSLMGRSDFAYNQQNSQDALRNYLQSQKAGDEQGALTDKERDYRASGMSEDQIASRMAGDRARQSMMDVFAKTPNLAKYFSDLAAAQAELLVTSQQLASDEKALSDQRRNNSVANDQSKAERDLYAGGYDPTSSSFKYAQARIAKEAEAKGLYPDKPGMQSLYVSGEMGKYNNDAITGDVKQNAQRKYETTNKLNSMGDTTGIVDAMRSILELADLSGTEKNKGISGLIGDYGTQQRFGLGNDAAMSWMTNDGDRAAYQASQSSAAFRRSYPGRSSSEFDAMLSQGVAATRASEGSRTAAEMVNSRKQSLAQAQAEYASMKATNEVERYRLQLAEELNEKKRLGIQISDEDKRKIEEMNSALVDQKALADAQQKLDSFAGSIRDGLTGAFKSAANEGTNFFESLGKGAKDLAQNVGFNYISTMITRKLLPGANVDDSDNPYAANAKRKAALRRAGGRVSGIGGDIAGMAGVIGGGVGGLLGAIAPLAGVSPMAPGVNGGLGQIIAQQVAMTASIVTITSANVMVNQGSTAGGLLGTLGAVFGGPTTGGKSSSQVAGPITANLRANRGLHLSN